VVLNGKPFRVDGNGPVLLRVPFAQIVPDVLNGLNALNLKYGLPLFYTLKRQLLARYFRQGHLFHFFERGQMAKILKIE
jgi:hypothetical protein